MKDIKIIDIAIILAVILSLGVGLLTYKNFRQTANKQIESTSKIAFQIYLRGVTLTTDFCPIKSGNETFISIRNVPYTNLKIVGVKIDPKKVVMPNPAKTPAFIMVDDYSQMFMYDIVVTVVDTAKITKDGAVVGGNKIKIGLPITLEGIDYKLNGTVSNVQSITEEFAKKLEDQTKKAVQQQKTDTAQATLKTEPKKSQDKTLNNAK